MNACIVWLEFPKVGETSGVPFLVMLVFGSGVTGAVRVFVRGIGPSCASTPFLPISDPFNGALKRPTQKANSCYDMRSKMGSKMGSLDLQSK
jgi:hypothetical protein